MTFLARIALVTGIFIAAFPGYSQRVDHSFKPQITDSPYIKSMAFQSDGKILLAGNIYAVGNEYSSQLVRLNSDGTLDLTFKKQQFSAGTEIRALAVDSQGRIVVGGFISTGVYAIRLNPDGSKDESFKFDSSLESPFKIIALKTEGYMVFSFGMHPIAKVNDKGALDNSFNAGKGPSGYGVSSSDMAVQEDGKIIVAGTFTQFNQKAVKNIVRLNPNGTLDESFSPGVGPQGSYPTISSIAIQADNKIILSGTFDGFNNTTSKNIVRLMPDGSVDPSFIVDGTLNNTFTYKIGRVCIHNNGILVAGVSNQVESVYTLMKINLNGTLDNTFHFQPAKMSSTVSTYTDPFLEVRGNIILIAANFTQIGSADRLGLAFLNSDGSLKADLNPSVGGPSVLRKVLQQPDGKILIAGSFNRVHSLKVGNIARLNADGSPDQAFIQNCGLGADRSVYTMALQSDGKVVVCGGFDTFNGNNRPLIVRLNQDGTIDNSFQSSLYAISIGPGINTIEILPSGKILLGGAFGYSRNSTSYRNLVRLNADGTIDNSFNGSMDTDNEINAMARLSDESILIGGNSRLNRTGGFLKKLDPNGNVINNFSTLDLSNQSFKVIRAFPDDSFVAGGTFSTSFSATAPSPIYQFDRNGVLVNKTSIAVYAGEINDISILSADELLITGGYSKINNINTSRIARVRLNGALTIIDYNDTYGVIYNALKVSASNNIFLVAGSFSRMIGVESFGLSKIDFDAPARPSNLSVSSKDITLGTITLNWTDNANDESGYIIERSIDGTVFTAIDSVGANAITYNDATPGPATNYTYRIAAYRNGEASASSNTVTVNTSDFVSPATPENLRYEFTSQFNSVNITWVDASLNESGFELERSLDNGEFQLLSKPARDSKSYQDTQITFDASYRYRIRAFNRFGKSAYSTMVELPIITGTEVESTQNATVYPNPGVNKLYYENLTSKPASISLYDTRGNLMTYTKSTQKLIETDVSSLPAGVYFVVISDGKESKTQKFLKY